MSREGKWSITITLVGLGKNAIAGFSFAGLMFPGGELLVRLICQPYFCR